MEQCCKNCRFWSFYETVNEGVDTRYSRGECRRYAPRLPADAKSGMSHGRIWPMTADVDWCGEFELRPSA